MTVNDPVGIGKAEVLGAVALDAPVARHRGLGRQFTQLWCGFAIANAVDGLAYGALPLLGLFVDRRPLAVAAVAASATLPWLLVALPAGALVDRYERGRVMAFSNLARGVVLAILTALIVMHHLNIELLVLLSLAVASARVVYYSASQAALKDILPKSALSRGNGVLTGTEAGAEHLGGPIVGSVAFVASRMLPFLADAVMMVVSGLWLFGLRTGVLRPSNEPSVEPEEMTRAEPAAVEKTGMLEGIRFLMADRGLRLIVALVSTLAGLQGLVAGVLVLVATRDWGVHTSYYGAFIATAAVGNVPGALLAPRMSDRFGATRTLLGSAAVSGLGYLVMAAASSWLLAGVAFAVGGFAVAVGSVVAVSMLQQLTPNAVQGRVAAAWRGLVRGAAPVGALAAGAIAVLAGLRVPLFLAGALQCIAAVLIAAPLVRATRTAAPVD